MNRLLGADVQEVRTHALKKAREEEEEEGRRSRIFFISREAIIGYLAEILILKAEGGASKCAKGTMGGGPVVCRRVLCKGEGTGRRSGTFSGSTGGPAKHVVPSQV